MIGNYSFSRGNSSITVGIHTGPEIYAITKVCFIVSIIVTTMHLLLITTNPLLRRLYGVSLCVTLYAMLTSYIGIICVCSILYRPIIGFIINLLTNTFILCIHTSIFVGILLDSYVLYTRGYSNPPSGKKRCRYLCFEAFIIILVPGLFVISFTQFNIQRYPNETLSSSSFILPKQEVICGVGSTHIVNVILFLSIFVISFVKIILIVFSARKFSFLTGECALMQSLRDMKSRFAMYTKLVVTNSIIWFIAYFALEFNVSSMWHIYTLCCSLQSIFLAISFIFSRPVLDILHGGDQSKGIGGLTLNKGMLYAAVPRLKLRNNIIKTSL